MAARIPQSKRRAWASLCAAIVVLPSCHPAVSLGGDASARGGNSTNTVGHSGTSGAQPVTAGGTQQGSGGVIATNATGSSVTGGSNSSVTGSAIAAGGLGAIASGGNPATGSAEPAGSANTTPSSSSPTTGGVSSMPTGGYPSTGGVSSRGGAGSVGTGGAVHLGGTANLGGAGATALIGGSGTGGTAGTSGTANGSDCLQLTEVECRLDPSCAAVLGPDARKPECAGDARGFSSCITGGCRDVATRCNELEDLDLMCSASCPSRAWAIGPDSGCPSCACVDDIALPNPGKGWDIVAWQEIDGWHYSLVYGTNRTKTCDEVKIHQSTYTTTGTVLSLALPNLVAVKAALTRIAAGGAGSFVMLCDRGCPDIDCQLDTMPAEVVQDIELFATALGVNLNIF